ncbi:MAG: hypothetical protein QM772_10960 [Ottowia sp.]|uniref:hypothetical protein n=1 Tax=Ottowia sp. TaxID=1898956 RepID=UPI0039E3667B
MSSPAPDKRRPGADSLLLGLADALSTIIAVGFGGSAAVVAAIGQFALAGVLGLVAFGIVLRLWRRRRRARARRTT